MSPVEDDPDMWAVVIRFAKSCFEWCATFSGLAVPALAGAVVGAFKQERRKRGKRKLILSILMSASCGCGLAPLFAHIFGIPNPVASSLAFFLGIWGLEGLEIIQNVFRSRGSGMSEHARDEGEEEK